MLPACLCPCVLIPRDLDQENDVTSSIQVCTHRHFMQLRLACLCAAQKLTSQAETRSSLRHGSVEGPQFGLVFLDQRQMQRITCAKAGLPSIQQMRRHTMVIVMDRKPDQGWRDNVRKGVDCLPCSGPRD